MSARAQQTLHGFFKARAIKWSAIGFLLTVCVTLPSAFYIAKVASERQVQTVARAAANAYRQQILDGHVRDAQFQMRNALGLSMGESVVVRDASLSAIYPLNKRDETSECPKGQSICWSRNMQYVHYLYPIYFDDEPKKELSGYLDLTLKPVVDQKVFALFFLTVCLAFIVQAIGLSSSLVRVGKRLTVQLTEWANHLRDTPNGSIAAKVALPFAEINLMQTAVDGLNVEIKRLEEVSANKAKAAAQLSILRELGHDLRTPLSQLAKFFSVLTHSTRSNGKLDEEIVSHIDRILVRMGNIVRQVRTVSTGTQVTQSVSVLEKETKLLLSDLAQDSEISQKAVNLQFLSKAKETNANVSPVALHRILENLIRNAVHAVDMGGEVTVMLDSKSDRPTLTVKDNGAGIPEDIQSKIFDFDFTTKPSRGTGLGLGIVKKLCNEIQAELSFVSEVGKGTEFQVSFQPARMEQ